MFIFTTLGALKSPVNILLILRQLKETDGKIKTWQIGNMEVTLGASALRIVLLTVTEDLPQLFFQYFYVEKYMFDMQSFFFRE